MIFLQKEGIPGVMVTLSRGDRIRNDTREMDEWHDRGLEKDSAKRVQFVGHIRGDGGHVGIV